MTLPIKPIFSVLLVSFVSLAPTHAQVKFPVELPTINIGDVTKYRAIDLWNNNELEISERKVVAIQHDRIVTELKSTAANNTRTDHHTHEWQRCRMMYNSSQPVCGGSLSFPMSIGNKHSYKLPSSNGNSFDSATCEVKGVEKISVPAGTFDTVRIECEGFWNRIVGDIRSGPIKTLNWYAPSIGRSIKYQYFSFNGMGTPTGSLPYAKNQEELIEFTSGK